MSTASSMSMKTLPFFWPSNLNTKILLVLLEKEFTNFNNVNNERISFLPHFLASAHSDCFCISGEMGSYYKTEDNGRGFGHLAEQNRPLIPQVLNFTTISQPLDCRTGLQQ